MRIAEGGSEAAKGLTVAASTKPRFWTNTLRRREEGIKGRRADTDVALATVMQRRLEGHGFEVEWRGAEKRRKRHGEEEWCAEGVVYNERGKERRGSSDDGWDTQVRGKERRYIWGQRMDRTEY